MIGAMGVLAPRFMTPIIHALDVDEKSNFIGPLIKAYLIDKTK